jgi:chromosome segregation ATPase
VSEWYLKKRDDEVYGPATTDELKWWATEGRVVPDDMLSRDQENWEPAPDAAELGMDWWVELPEDKPYGPVHLLALNELALDGLVSAALTIYHRQSGERHILGNAVIHALAGRRTSMEEAVAVMERDLAAREEELKMVRAGQAEAKTEQNVLSSTTLKLEEERKSLQDLGETARKAEQTHRQEIESLRLSLELTHRKEMKSLRSTLDEERREWHTRLEHLKQSHETLDSAASTRFEALAKSAEEMRYARDMLQSQIGERDSALEQLRDEMDALRSQLLQTGTAELSQIEERYTGQLQSANEAQNELRVATAKLEEERTRLLDLDLEKNARNAEQAHREEIESLRLSLEQSHHAEVESLRSSQDEERREWQARLNQLKKSHETLDSAATARLDAQSKSMDELRSSRDKLQKQVADREATLAQVRGEMEALHTKHLQAGTAELSQIEQRYSGQLESAHESAAQAAREIELWKGRFEEEERAVEEWKKRCVEEREAAAEKIRGLESRSSRSAETSKSADTGGLLQTVPANPGDQARLLEIDIDIDSLTKEASKWKNMYEEERTSARGIEERLTDRIEDLRRSEAEALTHLDDANRRLVDLERNYQRLAKVTDNETSGQDLRAELALVITSHNELSQNYDTLLSQLQQKTVELDAMVEQRLQVELDSAERVRRMEGILKREQEEANRAREQFSQIQESHQNLVKSYRDMNDRFIRFRQERVEGPDVPVPTEDAEAVTSGRGPRIRLR